MCTNEGAVCTSNSDCSAEQACTGIDSDSGEGQCADITINRGCDTDADCSAGVLCNVDGVCEESTIGPTWDYVAVVSNTTNSDDLDNTNSPGPDIDAVELFVRGQSTFAATVEAFQQGAGGNADGNVNAVVTSLLGANDAIPTGGGNCDLSEGELFWSMGDTTGFVVISFGNTSLVDGSTVRVWELDDLICTNVGVTRADSYEVLVGTSDVDVGTLSSVSDVSGANWLLLGSAPGSGGLQEFTVDLP